MGYSVSDAIESITLARGHAIERDSYISQLGRDLTLLPKVMDGKEIRRGVAVGEPAPGGINRPVIDKGKEHDKRHGPARDNFRGRDAWNVPNSSLSPWEPSHSQPLPEPREEDLHRPRRSEFVDESEFARQQNWGNLRSGHRPGSFQPGPRHDGPSSQYIPEGRHYRDEGRHSDLPGFDPKVPPPLFPVQRGSFDGRRPPHSEFVRDDRWAVDAHQDDHGSRHNPLQGRHSSPPRWRDPQNRISPPRGRPMSPQFSQRYSPSRRTSPPRSNRMSPSRRMTYSHGSRQLTPPPPPRSFRTPPPPTRSSPPGHRISPPRRHMSPRHGSPPRTFRPPSPRGRPISPPYSHHEQRFQPPHGNRMASPGRRTPPMHKPMIPRENLPQQYYGRQNLPSRRRSSGSPDRFHGRPDHLDKKYGPEIEPFPLERSPPRSMAEESHRIRRSRSPVRRQVPARRPPSFLGGMPPMRKHSPQMRHQQYLPNEASRSERRISPHPEPPGRIGRQQIDRGAPRQGTDWREPRDDKVRSRDGSLDRASRRTVERNRSSPGYQPRRHPESYIQDDTRSRPMLKGPQDNLKRPRPRTPESPVETRRGIQTPPEPQGAPRHGQRMPKQEELPVEPRRRGVRTPEPQDRRRGLRTPEPLDEPRRRGLRTPDRMDKPRNHELRAPEPSEPKMPRLGAERDEPRRLRTPEPYGPPRRGKPRSPERDVPRGQDSFRCGDQRNQRNEPPRSRVLRTPEPFDDPRRHGVLRTPEPLEEPRRHGVLRTPEPFDKPRRGGPPRTPDSPGREYRDNRSSGYRGRGNRRPFGNYRGQTGRGRGFRGGPMRYNDGNMQKPYLDQPRHSPQDVSPEYHDFAEYRRSRSRTPCMIDTPSVMDPFVEEEPDCRELLIEKRISSVTEEMRALSPSALDLINPDDEIIFIGSNSERVDSRSSSIGRRPAASRLSPRLPRRPPRSPPPKKPVFERLDDKKPPVFERLDSIEVHSPTERPGPMKRTWSGGRGRGKIALSDHPGPSRPRPISPEPNNRPSLSGPSKGAKSSRGLSSPRGLSRGLQPKTGVKKPPLGKADKAQSPPQTSRARRPVKSAPSASGVAKAPTKIIRKPINGSPVKKTRAAPRGRR